MSFEEKRLGRILTGVTTEGELIPKGEVPAFAREKKEAEKSSELGTLEAGIMLPSDKWGEAKKMAVTAETPLGTVCMESRVGRFAPEHDKRYNQDAVGLRYDGNEIRLVVNDGTGSSTSHEKNRTKALYETNGHLASNVLTKEILADNSVTGEVIDHIWFAQGIMDEANNAQTELSGGRTTLAAAVIRENEAEFHTAGDTILMAIAEDSEGKLFISQITEPDSTAQKQYNEGLPLEKARKKHNATAYNSFGLPNLNVHSSKFDMTGIKFIIGATDAFEEVLGYKVIPKKDGEIDFAKLNSLPEIQQLLKLFNDFGDDLPRLRTELFNLLGNPNTIDDSSLVLYARDQKITNPRTIEQQATYLVREKVRQKANQAA